MTVIGWILRKFGLLLLLVGGLLLAPSVWELWRIVGEFDPISVVQEIKAKIEILVPRKDAPKEEVERKLAAIEKQGKREKMKASREALPSFPYRQEFLDAVAANHSSLAVVKLPELDGAIGHVEFALLKSCGDAEAARRFVEFVKSPEHGRKAFLAAGFTELADR